MGYRTLRACVDDLAATGQLVRIERPVDPYLEAAEIHRRVYQAQGPAIYFAQVRGCRFPMVSNLFGTLERARYIFRDALVGVQQLIKLKVDPNDFWRNPFAYLGVARTAYAARPRRCRRGPVLENETTVDQLPQVVCWPRDGGAFITLPQVYTETPKRPGLASSNLGMYRIQISGGQYQPNDQVGLHYQIHRSIGIHHSAAIEEKVPFRVNIFVGGTPAMSLAAVMPLPETVSELMFGGALTRKRIPMVMRDGQLPVYGEADFCICGTVDPLLKLPEGPFGDHLGYYSLAHDFPVLNVEHVYHRHNPIWPFTVVGRPPQEDTVFSELIHELTGPVIPSVLPGVQAVHAVDAAGVHPLLLAIGSERYQPYQQRQRPQELLTQAHAILGQGQLSLAKFLFIVDQQDTLDLKINDVGSFLQHVLERVDWTRDLHFHTQTTIDTLDYSGHGFNQGSKLVIAAVGPPRRKLPQAVPAELRLPDSFCRPRVAMPGVLLLGGPACSTDSNYRESAVEKFCCEITAEDTICDFPLVVVVDDSEFSARSEENFFWVTFTRSNPAADVFGIDSFVKQKHWGCRGSLVVDARLKPHHAPPLVEDAEVVRRVNQLGAAGGPLFGVI